MPPGAKGTRSEVVLESLRKAKANGKARFLGVSTHSQMKEVFEVAIEHRDVYDIILTTYNYKLKADQDISDEIKRAKNSGMGVVAMKTLAGKFHDKDHKKPVNSIAALKWVLNNKDIDTALVTIDTYEKLEEYKLLMQDIELKKKELKELEKTVADSGMFCIGCEKCVPECIHNHRIPDIMRAYMYTYGYDKISDGYETLKNLAVKSDICSDCNECLVKCSVGFDIRQKMMEVSKIVDIPEDIITHV
jgi:predicted aldo/keto reductase-like oxidoreductase